MKTLIQSSVTMLVIWAGFLLGNCALFIDKYSKPPYSYDAFFVVGATFLTIMAIVAVCAIALVYIWNGDDEDTPMIATVIGGMVGSIIGVMVILGLILALLTTNHFFAAMIVATLSITAIIKITRFIFNS